MLFCTFEGLYLLTLKHYVAYYRVSTQKQGQSGLGLAAQRHAVRAYLNDDKLIVAEFTDIESGKNDNRPELLKAIETAKKYEATLVIAKLDRLSRNLTFISSLMDSGARFVCCDMPQANEFTIHIFAALAQQERRMISERTRRALAAKKQQGFQLGKPENLTEQARLRGLETRQKNAKEHLANRQATELVMMYRKRQTDGTTTTFAQIADKLNQLGYRTRRGCAFKPMTVRRLYIKTSAELKQKPTVARQ